MSSFDHYHCVAFAQTSCAEVGVADKKNKSESRLFNLL